MVLHQGNWGRRVVRWGLEGDGGEEVDEEVDKKVDEGI